MYHKDIRQGLPEWLFDKPDADELDERGCFSKNNCSEIDDVFMKLMQPAIGGFYFKEPPVKGTDPKNKWRTVSCLQKAIRFGDVEMAMFAASAAYDMDSTYLRRRMMVIAVEDVMAGNLPSVAYTLACGANPQWRKSIDERRLMMWLARSLAERKKDRTLVDLLVLVGETDAIDKVALCKRGDDQLVALVHHSNLTIERLTAAWALAGSKRYNGGGMPEDNDRTPTRLFAAMAARGMTRFGLWLAARICSRTQDAMWIATMIMDQWLDQTDAKGTVFVKNKLPPMPKVGKLLGASYDQHTREGRIAIAKFYREQVALKPFMDAAPEKSRQHLQFNSVFRGEGGMLNEQVFYGDRQMVYDQVARGENRYRKLLPPELAVSLIPMVQGLLPELNEARGKVLYASQMSKA